MRAVFIWTFLLGFNSSPVFAQQMKKEFIMPVISTGEHQKDGRTRYTFSTVDHQPNYFLQLRIGMNIKEFNFAQDFLENKESLFYEYNLNLRVIELWKRLEKQVANLNNH